MQPQKPGWQTSEMWLTLVAQILPVLVTTGVIGTGDVATVEGALNKGITAAFAFGAAAWTLASYIKGRVEVKTS